MHSKVVSPVGPGWHGSSCSWLLGFKMVVCLSIVVCEVFNEILCIIRKSLGALEIVSLESDYYPLFLPYFFEKKFLPFIECYLYAKHYTKHFISINQSTNQSMSM